MDARLRFFVPPVVALCLAGWVLPTYAGRPLGRDAKVPPVKRTLSARPKGNAPGSADSKGAGGAPNASTHTVQKSPIGSSLPPIDRPPSTASASLTTPDPDSVAPPSDGPAARPTERTTPADALGNEVPLTPEGTSSGVTGKLADQAALDATSRVPTLDLQTVLDSVYTSYPLLESAVLERVVKDGAQVAALGEFDLKLKAESTSAPIGFYRNYRNGVGLEQPLWTGGQFEAGYRTGHGNFEPWFGGRETDEGGEYKVGLYTPWIRNRRIDDRRAELFKRRVERTAVEPFIQSEFLDFIRESSIAYWGWVGAGAVLDINKRLLSLAEQRTDVFNELFKNQKAGRILIDDNQRLIATRRGKVAQSEQKLRESAIKLSLFVRTSEGKPYIARPDQLAEFPEPVDRSAESLEEDIQTAWARRPELTRLNLDRQRLDIEFEQGRNLALAQVDSFLNLKDGLGNQASAKQDKSPLALEAGVIVSMPYQRRKGLGKMQEVRGKIGQLNLKIQFQRDKIATEVQSAVNYLLRSYERVLLAREAVRLSEELAEVEREKFKLQRSDFLAVNIREDAVANAEIVEVEALFDYYVAQASLAYALAMDIERIAGRSIWNSGQ